MFRNKLVQLQLLTHKYITSHIFSLTYSSYIYIYMYEYYMYTTYTESHGGEKPSSIGMNKLIQLGKQT